MKEGEQESLTPGVLLLVAILSIGGLMFLGYTATLTGNAAGMPYTACCSVESWRNAPIGYVQGEGITTQESCNSYESPAQCCLRAAQARSEYPLRLLGAVPGSCNRPEVNYPVQVLWQTANQRS